MPQRPNDVVDELATWGIPALHASQIANHYLRTSLDLAGARERLLTDWIFHLPMARAAAAADHQTAWIAVTTVPDTGPTGHFDDTTHLFGTILATRDQQQFGNRLREAVLRFTRTGDPGWPAFTTPKHPVNRITATTWQEDGALDEVLATWSGVNRP